MTEPVWAPRALKTGVTNRLYPKYIVFDMRVLCSVEGFARHLSLQYLRNSKVTPCFARVV